ncbi:hypothetical protein CFC21_112747, partial [Triticum aestivum]
CA